ncbi:MAG: ABC transporter ATP-binding protein [Deltaproteobacteria bacterium]|nr:ABC transporter ATP-binding protein [Deltaproteobacteria bacterium]
MALIKPILSIQDLSVAIEDDSGSRIAINGLSLDVTRGQTLALVGESGSGKSLTAMATLGILPTPPAHVTGGSIIFDGMDLLALSEREMLRIRGDRMAMIFQEPVTSLNPVMPVGQQIGEAILLHQGLDKQSAREQVYALMELVGIPDPRRRYGSYPHQLSGGVRQRVVIAMALACRPDLLLADEPTSALDATVRAQIVDLLSRLIRDLGMSVLLITHDLGLVAAMAERVVVLHAGRVVEQGSAGEILKNPLHPYTQALLAARTFSRNTAPTSRLAGMGAVDPSSNIGADICPFASLCPDSTEACWERPTELVDVGHSRKVRCIMKDRRHG